MTFDVLQVEAKVRLEKPNRPAVATRGLGADDGIVHSHKLPPSFLTTALFRAHASCWFHIGCNQRLVR